MVRQGMSRLFHYFNLVADALAVSLALVAAYYLRFSGWPIPLTHLAPSLRLYGQALPVVIGITWICYQYAGLYLQRRGISGVDEFSRIIKATTVAFFILVGFTFFYRRETYSRVVLAFAWFFTLAGVTFMRSLLRRIQVMARRQGIGVSRLALVGQTETARLVADQVRRYPGLGYRLIGYVTETRVRPTPGRDARILGTIKNLREIIERENIDEVIFALPAQSHSRLEEVLLAVETSRANFKIVSDLFGIITNPMTVDEIYGIPVFALKESPLSWPLTRAVKRSLDLVLTVPLLILLSPLLAGVALAVKISSPGPVFFRQERVGRGNQSFGVLKFRSMRPDAEKKTGPVWAKKDDDRRTPIGGFLRKTSLDELPQLFNVLKGEMSLVGPGPERPHFVDQFKQQIPRYLDRHKVKTGITGWAQVHGLRGNTPIEERTKYDVWYVENWSLGLDIKILFRTALEVFHHKEAY
jgi:exopolysaccharide biosynthesis polyprenyl glycosylphosphotransferase